jgi:hypothetical protein
VSRRRLALLGLPLLLGVSWLLTPRYGVVPAMRPTLQAVDEDADGRVVSAELARSSPTLISFHKIDLDGDGALSEPELLGHLLAEDPLRFDHANDQLGPSPSDHLRYSNDAKPIRVTRVLFQFMVAEVLAVDRRIPLPSEEQIRAAAFTGMLDSPESQLVASNMVAAYQACRLEVPAMLVDVAPVMAEPGLREPPGQGGGRKRRGSQRRSPPPSGAVPPPGHHPPPFPSPNQRR